MDNKEKAHDPFLAMRVPAYRLYVFGRVCITLAITMQGMIVQWQVYQITNDVFYLGMIGLTEAIPSIIVSLFAGHIADIRERRGIILSTLLALILCAFSLFFFTLDLAPDNIQEKVLPIFIIIFITGLVRGFYGPAMFAYMPQLLPDKSFYSNAVSWNSSSWQAAAVSGPILGGLLLVLGEASVQSAPIPHFTLTSLAYLTDLLLLCVAFVPFLILPVKPLPERVQTLSMTESLAEGLSFVFKNELILSAISLDLFAVLFGGAVGLLPAVCKEILHVGPAEMGFLRAAEGIGSVLMALFISFNPIKKNAGRKLLFAVAGFGLSIVVFGFSTNFWLSLLVLIIAGAFDGVSVVLRSTLIQTMTPEHMKGRVSSVNNIFIGSSNEIGAFESGVTAKLMGTRLAVIFGGCMTMLVVAATGWRAKKLRQLDL